MLSKAEIESYRRKLLALKKRLGADLTALEEEGLRPTGGEAAGNLADVPVHPADLGTDNYEEELALELMENEDQILQEIDHALERIEQGTFGRCGECGQEISRQRLDAVPYSRYCAQHARANFSIRPRSE